MQKLICCCINEEELQKLRIPTRPCRFFEACFFWQRSRALLQQQQKQHTTYIAREVASANTFFFCLHTGARWLRICTSRYTSFPLSISSPSDGTWTWPSYLTHLNVRAQQSLPRQNKHTRTVQSLQRSVYAREDAADVDRQESGTHIL